MAVKRARTTLPSFGLSARGAASLSSHIKFLQYLASPRFYEDFKSNFRRQDILDRLRITAQAVIRSRIYGVYTPRKYVRTFQLLESFLAAFDTENELANISVYSNPETAPAKLIPGHSYAEFFDPRSEHGTFLLNVLEPEDAIRPFVVDLLNLMEEQIPEEAGRSFEDTMQSHKPA